MIRRVSTILFLIILLSIINCQERTAAQDKREASRKLDRGVAAILQDACDAQGKQDDKDTAWWKPTLQMYLQRYDYLDWLTFCLILIIILNYFCSPDFEMCAKSRTKC